MNTLNNKLHGLTVLVTRPVDLAKQLASRIEQLGARPIIYPVISIETTPVSSQTDQLLQQLDSFDIAIFISPSAVTTTFERINKLPSLLRVAAIGSSTENALHQYKVAVSIKPEGHNSEALLALKPFQTADVKGKSIIIFRGTGGREHLGDTLNSRGAEVHYAEMYQRVLPQNTVSLTDDELNNLDIITVTSNEGLQNLFKLTDSTDLLCHTPLLVPGERCLQLAKTLGFNSIVQAENATDAACIEALIQWAGSA